MNTKRVIVVKDYKLGDAPDNNCLHSDMYFIKFRFMSKNFGESWGIDKCVKCDKFTPEEIEVLKNESQYSKEFIETLSFNDKLQ